MSADVWVQAGRVGKRFPLEGLEETLAEWEARWGKPGDQYAIHDGRCHLGRTSTRGCTCSPEIRTIGARA